MFAIYNVTYLISFFKKGVYIDIFIQIVGGAGLIANLLSFQFKNHKHIMFFRTANECLFILQYFLLGAFAGSILNIVGCIRNILFARQVAQGKKTVLSTAVFCILFTALGIASFGGFSSIMLIFAKVLSTIAYGNKNTTVIRVVSFVTHISYFVYNISVFSIAGAVSDLLLLISLIFSIARFDIIPFIRKQTNS